MGMSRTQLKESLAARDAELAFACDLVSYLDRLDNPAISQAMHGARAYAEELASRRRARKARIDTLQQQVQRAFGHQIDRGLNQEIFMGQNVTAKRNYPTREEIETAARVCEQLGHRVTALALRNRLERSDA